MGKGTVIWKRLNYINENNIVVTSENRDEVEQDLNVYNELQTGYD